MRQNENFEDQLDSSSKGCSPCTVQFKKCWLSSRNGFTEIHFFVFLDNKISVTNECN